jgi:hypothetical protein
MEDTGNDRAVGLDADHLQICKFKDGDNSNAKRVLQTFEALYLLMKEHEEAMNKMRDLPIIGSELPLEERMAAFRS